MGIGTTREGRNSSKENPAIIGQALVNVTIGVILAHRSEILENLVTLPAPLNPTPTITALKTRQIFS